MAEFATLIRKRGSVKAKLTSFKKHIEKTQIDLQNVESTENAKQLLINELEERIIKFESCLPEFEKFQDIIEEQAADATIEAQYKERRDFEDEYYKTVTLAKDLVNKNKQINAVKPCTNANESVNAGSKQYNHINLPNIKLPSFNGKFENWTEFRNTFITLFQNNRDLNDLERFHYLRSSLVEDAEGALRSIPFTAENYSVAWAHVCKRYDNKSMIVVNHMKAIDNLPILQKESFRDLSNLIDEVNKHLTSWNAVQNATEQFETLIIHIIKSKLDKYTRLKWEEQKTGDKLPTWKEFNLFLQERTEKLYSRDINNKLEVKQKPAIKAFLLTANKCPICQEDHMIYKCKKLLVMKPVDRLEQVRKLKLCTNCLRSNHINRDCKAGGCRICNAKHNTLLHFESRPEDATAAINQEADKKVISLSSRFQQSDQSNQTNVILSTIQVQVIDKTGYPIVCRALLDSGSQANFISTQLQQRLQIPTQNVQVAVQGINQTSSMLKHRCQVLVKSISNDYSQEIMCFVLDAISNNIPNIRIDKNQFSIPAHIKLADPQFHVPQQIDLIIGAPLFWKIICVGQHNLGDNMPVLQKTRFGWIIGGAMQPIQKPTIIQCNFANTCSIEEQIEKFWSIEEINQKKILSQDDRHCEEIFDKTITQDSNGRFIVTIPFKEPLLLLGNSKEFALQRFYALERRLTMDPVLCQQYCQFMKEYEELEHMSEDLDTQPVVRAEYFFPHHGVVNPNSTTTKLRVVFDGSAKSDTGYSINALQYTGPNIQEELINIILRFRMYNIVITADIEKMYRQILVQPDQRPLQKIFWRSNPEEAIKVFKLNTVTYGTASAPFLAVRCLKQLAMNHEQQYPKISRIIAEDFYMDDLLSGANTTEEIQTIITTIITIMKSVGFYLRKWTSNESEIIKNQLSPSNAEVHFDTKDNTKILGLYWCSDSDTFRFKINSKPNDNNRITKRIIISELAQIFDPLGLLAPCIIMGKIIIRKLWLLKLSWDESVTLDIHTQWINFRNQLPVLNEKQIQRQVICKNATNMQLHGFCDSSAQAYGACVYVRSENSNKEIHVKLLCSKTRVAPLKTITIPRLELCSAVLLSKLIQKVLASLRITINQIYKWSDSTIALNWIRTEPYKLNIFVANSVNQIQNLTNVDYWRYVNTKNNPADLLTRGTTPSMLVRSTMWWTGPTWLKEPEDQWPQVECNKLGDIPETKRQYIISMHTVQSPPWILFSRFSKLSRQNGELTSVDK